MIDLISYYSIFALAGGIMSIWKLFIPIRNKMIVTYNESHSFVESPIISGFIWLLLSIIFITLIINALLFDVERNRFIDEVVDTGRKG